MILSLYLCKEKPGGWSPVSSVLVSLRQRAIRDPGVEPPWSKFKSADTTSRLIKGFWGYFGTVVAASAFCKRRQTDSLASLLARRVQWPRASDPLQK